MVHMIENQWVAAVYNNNWYILISKIQEVNRNDGDVHLTFLERMNTKGAIQRHSIDGQNITFRRTLG